MLVHEPEIPFVDVIPGGLSIGSKITINAHSTGFFASHFQVNLVVGHQPTLASVHSADIALHFNPRFEGKDTVVLNSRAGGVWGEEKVQNHDLPLKDGQDFKLQIFVEESYFRISVNGEHFVDYVHHMAVSSIGLIHIEGAIKVKRIKIRTPEGRSYPSYDLGAQSPGFPPLYRSSETNEVVEPKVPFAQNFSGLNVGSKITVNGTFIAHGKHFEMDLVLGQYPEGEHDFQDIAIHFNPRHQDDENVIVMNSRENGQWGEEVVEQSDGLLEPNADFEIVIYVELDSFHVNVNGGRMAFPHRGPFREDGLLYIKGDVLIHRVKYAV